MTASDLSNSELLILGLISEMPRHGYELETVIDKRGMREWTQIGFSSIYYTLGKLNNKGYITAETPESEKSKKRYSITGKGTHVLKNQAIRALKTLQPSYPSLLLGMIHIPTLSQEQVVEALRDRRDALSAELERIKGIHFDQQPLPDYIDAVFEYSINQLNAEADWVKNTLAYLKTKTWIY